jgi:murein DD-endopeptidase MepM/ murein hydrolase activator NlpD
LNQTLGDILNPYGISHQKISRLAESAKDVFSVRNLQVGKKCSIVRDNQNGEVIGFVYEPSPYRYVKYHLTDSIFTEMQERLYETCVEEAKGVIVSSLWVSMQEEGYKHALIVEMENALAWSIDFHHILKGDAYKLVFERQYIDGEPVGIGRLLGAYFKNYENEYYSIYFKNPSYEGYYDEEGRPMKKAFLKAPVRYSRISSRYNPRRFHPVLKRTKGHFGTDYAASCGTPIMAVADGLIEKAGYTGGNGNYIKIKHDRMYQTQYLHMTRFATDMRSGVHVKQGQVIGYVGKTGLATGCHVCFRFWKNGKQVDHLREKLPPPDPMPEEALPIFFKIRDQMKTQLDNIPDPVLI